MPVGPFSSKNLVQSGGVIEEGREVAGAPAFGGGEQGLACFVVAGKGLGVLWGVGAKAERHPHPELRPLQLLPTVHQLLSHQAVDRQNRLRGWCIHRVPKKGPLTPSCRKARTVPRDKLHGHGAVSYTHLTLPTNREV